MYEIFEKRDNLFFSKTTYNKVYAVTIKNNKKIKYMLYLIGGSPRGGKSILSRKLSKKLNTPYLSTDNIKPIVMAYFKGENKHKHFPTKKMFDYTAVDKFFKNYNGRQYLSAGLKEAKSIWPGARLLILQLLLCKMDYIIEGVHLLPNLVNEFKGNRNVKVIFLTKTNEEKIYNGLLKNKDKKDWIMSNIKNKDIIRLAAKSFCIYGEYFLKESKKYRFKYFNTEDNFQSQLNEAIRFLTN